MATAKRRIYKFLLYKRKKKSAFCEPRLLLFESSEYCLEVDKGTFVLSLGVVGNLQLPTLE